MKKIVMLIAIILYGHIICGQEIASQSELSYPMEDLEVHLTQTCLFPGEVIGFNIYCTNLLFPGLELSRMAFIELVSDSNASILRKKILLVHGAGGGEFSLPDDLSSGIYAVLTYTNWLKNFGEGSFNRQRVMIIHPDQGVARETDTSGSLQNDRSVLGAYDNSHSDLIILPDKEQYATRERVSLNLKLSQGEGAGGHYSVSVCRTEPALYLEHSEMLVRGPAKEMKEIEYLPDFRGIRLTGKLEDASGNVIKQGRVILSEPGPGTKISSTLSDKDGSFHFLLQPQEGEKDLVFTLPVPGAVIKLEEPFWNGFKNPPAHQELHLSDNTVSFLEEKFLHFQLQHKFNHSNFSESSQSERSTIDSSRFYTHYSRLLKMDDYILLDSLPEYFYELVPSVKFIHSRGKFDLRVLDPGTGFRFKENPGVFVDGVLYSDYNGIARIPVNKIKNIAILPEVYYYHDLSFGGIIDLHAKNSDFSTVSLSANMIRLIFPLAARREMRVNAPDYSLPDNLRRNPDFRYLICWEPDVTIGDSGEQT
ncbi:MAG: hypothetical protein KAH12_11025, partial [Anaerolineales bacterium]|nr:hypothetical protein [Anaerolineales bacterium]